MRDRSSVPPPEVAYARPRPLVYKVTRRQNEVLHWRSLGLTAGEIAHQMNVTEDTVKELSRRLYRNLDVASGPEAVRVGFETGLLTPRVERYADVVTRYVAPRGRQPAPADQRVS